MALLSPLAGSRKRSQFVVEAAREKLERDGGCWIFSSPTKSETRLIEKLMITD